MLSERDILEFRPPKLGKNSQKYVKYVKYKYKRRVSALMPNKYLGKIKYEKRPDFNQKIPPKHEFLGEILPRFP